MVLYGPHFSLMFLIHLFLYAGVYCMTQGKLHLTKDALVSIYYQQSTSMNQFLSDNWPGTLSTILLRFLVTRSSAPFPSVDNNDSMATTKTVLLNIEGTSKHTLVYSHH